MDELELLEKVLEHDITLEEAKEVQELAEELEIDFEEAYEKREEGL